MDVAVRVRGLRKSYAGELVLAGVELEVARGESLGIVGPNGAGKSTLLRIIAGIEPYDSGQVEVYGRAVLVPQDNILLPWRTVRGNALLAARIAGIDRGEAAERLERWSGILGLSDYLDRYPSQLSGGTARKAMILMALILKPDILLLDEPFTGLDVSVVRALQESIRKLKAEGLTMIVVSHMLSELAEVSDRIAFLTHKPARISRLIDLRGKSRAEAARELARELLGGAV